LVITSKNIIRIFSNSFNVIHLYDVDIMQSVKKKDILFNKIVNSTFELYNIIL